jgi:hypothetical protein
MNQKEAPSPEEFFGFKLGSDRKLARWDKIVEYYQKLDQASDKIKVEELGKSTEGNTFLLVIITSPENMKHLEEIRASSLKLAYNEELSESEAESIIDTGKVVFAVNNSIHASEVGGTQMSPELAYDLITDPSPTTERILRDVVLLMVPCANPDGNIMIVDWYNQMLGTEYEGGNIPWLYHKYAGHSLNGEVIMMNLPESKMLARLLFVDWFPQAFIDHHHYGSYSGRYLVPPFANPVDQNVDPLIWTEMQLYGGAMMVKLEQMGKIGVENQVAYPGVGPAEFSGVYTRVVCWHGICGMLTESASAKLATPIYVHYQQLEPSQIGRPEYRAQINFPHPWPGGWWKLREIVEQQKISTIAALEVASNYRETILRNLFIKAKRTREQGRTEPPFALLFPPRQHDPFTTTKLLDVLLNLGIKIHKAEEAFQVGVSIFPEGTHIIFYSQITRPYLLSTMRSTLYHVSPWVKTSEGKPKPGSRAADLNMAELLGSTVFEVENPFSGKFVSIDSITKQKGGIRGNSNHGFLLDGRLNDSFKAVNKLLKEDYQVFRVEVEIEITEAHLPIGAFFIPSDKEVEKVLDKIANEFNLIFHSVQSALTLDMHEIKQQRVSVYQRYYGGNADEGWTRWLLEEYGFDYTTVRDQEIKGKLDEYDVLIFPSDASPMITGKKIEEHYEKQGRTLPKYPPKYRSGIGDEGIEKVREFVKAGGTLIALNMASNFVLDEVKLPIKNILKDLDSNEFFCPGSTLRVEVDGSKSLAYGVPQDLVLPFSGAAAFEIKPVENNNDYEIIIKFPDENMLKTGWLKGESYLSRKAALIEAKMGKGRIVLYGFSPQSNARTNATFKLLFNALI